MKKNILMLKERKNFLKGNIRNHQDLLTTLNILVKNHLKLPLQVGNEKVIVLKVRGNLKIEAIDLNNLPSKGIIKKDKNFRTF